LLEGSYEDWVLSERERLRERFIQTLEHLSQALKSMLDYEQALNISLRLVQVEPLRESAHREIMRLQHLLGHKESALKQYEECVRILKDELGLEPEPETIELAREITRRSPLQQLPYLPETNTLPGASLLEKNAPERLPLIGRSLDKQMILALVESALNRKGTFVVIEGEPGIGKTRLINEIQRDLEWHGIQVVGGKASEYETGPSQGMLIQILQSGLSPLRVMQIRSLAKPEQLPVLEWTFAYLLSPGVPAHPAEISSNRDQRQVSQERDPIPPEIYPEHKIQQYFHEHKKEYQAERQKARHTPCLCQEAGKNQGKRRCQEEPQNADQRRMYPSAGGFDSVILLGSRRNGEQEHESNSGEYEDQVTEEQVSGSHQLETNIINTDCYIRQHHHPDLALRIPGKIGTETTYSPIMLENPFTRYKKSAIPYHNGPTRDMPAKSQHALWYIGWALGGNCQLKCGLQLRFGYSHVGREERQHIIGGGLDCTCPGKGGIVPESGCYRIAAMRSSQAGTHFRRQLDAGAVHAQWTSDTF
jgi:hypothetical protein